MKICPYCDEFMAYIGLDDGGGDYGDSVCEQWECEGCGYAIETNCISEDELDDSDWATRTAEEQQRDYPDPWDKEDES